MPIKGNKERYLIVSIDVEEDMPNWKIEDSLTIRNLNGIPQVQALFEKYNVRPTYLLNYAFASNEKAVGYFKSISDRCEIGAHMHPWNTPPLTIEESKKNDYPSNLPYERQYEKIKTVTDILTKAFHKPPTAYRAGRFGFNEDTKDILISLGYLVDTSISPMISWEEDNGPSFLNYRASPFWMHNAESKILEVPVTIGLSRDLPGWIEKIYLRLPAFTRIRGLLSRDYLKLVDLFWLYPAVFTETEMITLVDVMIEKSLDVFNVFFHSSEIEPGESIYTRTEEDVKKYFKRLEIFFDYVINEVKMKSVTLSEYRERQLQSRSSN